MESRYTKPSVSNLSENLDFSDARAYTTLSLEIARVLYREQQLAKWLRRNRQTILNAQREYLQKCSQ